MKNFVTYTAAEFFPGPNMNLVIGPNGSGKSTIVCAICLGLGYRPDVLGRATAVGDYVQHGKEVAEIEIELAQKNGQSVVVKRKIKRDKNQSTYYLNGIPPNQNVMLMEGKQDTLAKVQELMAIFNIQIDNLWYQLHCCVY
jgi:chromosome segregation ATPase